MPARLFLTFLLALLILPGSLLHADTTATGQAQKAQLSLAKETPNSSGKPVKIGVLAFRGKDMALLRWSATADYLTKSVKGYHFEIVPLSLDEMDTAVQKGDIDFSVTNSGHYITLAARYGVSRLVTLNARGPSSHENKTGSVVFTRADRTDIKALDDLQGKTFMSVSPQAFCFQSAWHRMQKEGINPFKDFTKLLFVGFPQDYIAMAVKRGIIDAGNVRTGVLEAMAAEGKIKLSDFRILAPQKPKGFPYVTTTQVYPEWPFMKMKETDASLAKNVAIALLSMSPESDAARMGHYAGWTVPLDYSPVQDLFRTLKIGPYDGLGELTLASFFAQYKAWIIMAASLLLISILWSMRTERVVARRTAELAEANDALADQIAERRRAEEIARQRQDELSRMSKMKSMGELASGIAHELNHPLATVVNYASGCIRRLRSGKDDKEEVVEVLEKVTNHASRASQIINGLRENMRDDQRKRQVEDINEIIRNASDLLEFNLKNSETRLELSLSDQLPDVKIDPIQIEQVLLNLVGNSIDAMRDHGSANRQVRVMTSVNPEDEIIVCVADTGPGVAEEIREEVFHPFITTKSEGMGLGLSISCSIIKDHGGQLWIESSSAQGAEICFSLPTGGDDEEAQEPAVECAE